MNRRAQPSGLSISENDAAIVKGMLLRGDRQHDIAAWFGVNGGRVAEIASGKRFQWVRPASRGLPPAGPYPTGRNAVEAKLALEKALNALAEAEEALDSLAHR